jgi:hypothetical protein
MSFSNKKKDSAHNTSFRSSLLRIPCTFNSKNQAEVKIIHEFDKNYILSINSKLLRSFRLWLVDNDLRNQQERLKRFNKSSSKSKKDDTIKTCVWIEMLLQTPIPHHRKYCLFKIIVPYLVNIRKLSNDECFDIVNKWLEKCNSISKISFDIDTEIKTRLKAVKDYKPISIPKLRKENAELFNLFEDKINDISL